MIGIFGKMVLNTGISAFQLLFYQYVIMTLCLGALILFKNPRDFRISRKTLGNLIIQGAIGATGTSVFYYLAIERINVGMASMLLFTYPIFVNLFFIFSGIRKIGTVSKIALALAFIGSSLVLNIFTTGLSGISVIGISLGILASFCYAFFNIYADLKLSNVKAVVLSFYTSLTTMLVSIIPLVIIGQMPAASGSGSLISEQMALLTSLASQGLLYQMLGNLLLLSLICGVLPTILMYKGISLVGADKASIISTFELPLTIIFAFIFLKETMVLMQIVGIIMIVAAVLLLHKSEKGGL